MIIWYDSEIRNVIIIIAMWGLEKIMVLYIVVWYYLDDILCDSMAYLWIHVWNMNKIVLICVQVFVVCNAHGLDRNISHWALNSLFCETFFKFSRNCCFLPLEHKDGY